MMSRPSIRGFLAILLLAAGVTAGHAQTQTAPSPDEILNAWLASPHADSGSQAFRRWDGEGEVPGRCAVCHSTTGLVAYLSGAQSPVNAIDHAVAVGTTVECAACHDPAARALGEVLFPSGQSLPITDGSAVCAVCHQGRASGETVSAALAGLADDTVSADIAFINVHYAAAAATRFGTLARGGYEYPDQTYAGRFDHVEPLSSCIACHGAHDTSVQIERCTACHQGVSDVRAIRFTPIDVLGTGDTTSGMASVIADLSARLDAAIRLYATEVTGMPVVYSADTHPYFFNDLDADGVASETEAAGANRYQSWTPRLLRAAYNYQFVAKDHGAFAHNPRYAMQLLIDSIGDLAQAAPVDVTGLTRP